MKACKGCRYIVYAEKTCPKCNSTDLSDKFSGMVIILDAERSEVAKISSLATNGIYAVKIK